MVHIICFAISILIFLMPVSSQANAYTMISQDEAQQIMTTESNICILDVRTRNEFNNGHIVGAICVPVETITDEPPKELPLKNQKILVYCRSGRRSKIAAQKLVKLGYIAVYEFGGITTWQYGLVK